MTDLTPLQRARKDLENINDWAKEHGVDSFSLMLLAKDIQRRCAAGVLSERICMKTETGVAEVNERLPAVEIAALQFIHKVSQDALRQLEKEAPPDPSIHIHMTRVRLEDTLEKESP